MSLLVLELTAFALSRDSATLYVISHSLKLLVNSIKLFCRDSLPCLFKCRPLFMIMTIMTIIDDNASEEEVATQMNKVWTLFQTKKTVRIPKMMVK